MGFNFDSLLLEVINWISWDHIASSVSPHFIQEQSEPDINDDIIVPGLIMTLLGCEEMTENSD